jgi:uncharacterized spore protein YtfJ
MARRRSPGPVSRLAADVTRGAGAAAVFGRPVAQGGTIVIPVARVRFAFGGGGGRGRHRREAGEGGGGAAVVRPAGFIELRGGRARYRRIRGAPEMVAAAVALALAVVAWRAGRPGQPAASRAVR